MNNGKNSRKRPPPSTPTPPPPPKHRATMEEEYLDEDVFLDETLIGDYDDEESLILRDMENRQALASRLDKWARPALSQGYISQSQSIIFQQLEIDYVIGGSEKELLPNLSGRAAIIRIFGVTKEVGSFQLDFIREVDPNIIIGYNICKFDLPYLIERAETLKLPEFSLLGRIRNSKARVKDTTFSSRAVEERIDHC